MNIFNNKKEIVCPTCKGKGKLRITGKISFGMKIKKLRESRGMTQMDLAKKIQRSRATVANIEVGFQNVTFDMLYSIADALNTEVKDLV